MVEQSFPSPKKKLQGFPPENKFKRGGKVKSTKEMGVSGEAEGRRKFGDD
jgi:hypothetical protein